MDQPPYQSSTPNYQQGWQQPNYQPLQQPYYQPPVMPPKKKGNGLIIGAIILGAVFLLCGVCGIMAVIASSSHPTSNTSTGLTPAEVPTVTAPQATAPTTQQHFKVGDQVTVGTIWKVVVNGVKTDDGGQFSSLKAGDTYVLVDVSLTNLSNQEQNVSSILNFTFKDSTGQKYDESIDINAGASTPDGKVAAGDTLRGTIAYEVPVSQKTFTFAFAPDILSPGQTIWDLSM
jgi:hypothetical protein